MQVLIVKQQDINNLRNEEQPDGGYCCEDHRKDTCKAILDVDELLNTEECLPRNADGDGDEPVDDDERDKLREITRWVFLLQ